MKNAAYYNGTISAIEDIKVPLEDRAVYFGDGVYDVSFCHNGKPFLIDEHFERFYNSCRLVRIDFPYTREQLLGIINDLISRLDDRSDVLIYWQASRGTAPRNHPFPENSKANLLMYVKPKKITKLDVPMKLHTVDDIRYEMCNVKTINLIPNILAAQAAIDAGCDEAVQIRRRLFEDDGTEYRDVVTEGAHTNIAILKNGEYITAPLGHFILPGIARSHLIGICRANGIPVVERYITRAELADADEILISSTTTLVRRASSTVLPSADAIPRCSTVYSSSTSKSLIATACELSLDAQAQSYGLTAVLLRYIDVHDMLLRAWRCALDVMLYLLTPA